MDDIKISNIKQDGDRFSYFETFDVDINGKKYFCTKDFMRDFFLFYHFKR